MKNKWLRRLGWVALGVGLTVGAYYLAEFVLKSQTPSSATARSYAPREALVAPILLDWPHRRIVQMVLLGKKVELMIVDAEGSHIQLSVPYPRPLPKCPPLNRQQELAIQTLLATDAGGSLSIVAVRKEECFEHIVYIAGGNSLRDIQLLFDQGKWKIIRPRELATVTHVREDMFHQ